MKKVKFHPLRPRVAVIRPTVLSSLLPQKQNEEINVRAPMIVQQRVRRIKIHQQPQEKLMRRIHTAASAALQQTRPRSLTLSQKKIRPPLIRVEHPVRMPNCSQLFPILKTHQTAQRMQPLRVQDQQTKQMIRRRLPKATVTAALLSPTPPPLFCFFFLCLRLLLRWWPRESEGERAVHRPHTHSSFTHSLCVSPCMDSRPHLTPRSTHIMCPLYICMHTHAGPLVLSFARHAPLPSCLAAWTEHRNCFVSIELSGRPLSLSPCVCVLLYGSNESVCAGRPTPRLFFLVLFYCFTCVVVEWTCYSFFFLDYWVGLTADT
ncbi:hypothetical protein ECC02_009661 [Trypanosoma cruzi]|uniref:Uncharacterized protein n=1 Tax=Trypanosoma cruzi TaxID=5693 RepID=A0A7J6XT97_TRYCR|nr:hypothetical protein ECC02_009661 [Trypanosoma cruzi]